MTSRPDTIYWRRVKHTPDMEYIRPENIHFWPGQGPCVDGYYYWIGRNRRFDDPRAIIRRIPLEIWELWGRTKHPPEEEKPWPDALQERLTRI